MWLSKLYHNHVLATLAYLMVLLLGILAYPQLPREQAPEAQFKIVSITITLPGASAEDVERFVIDPVERMLKAKIKDIDHVNSDAQGGNANITVTFKDIKQALYDRRVQELRREVQAIDLPKTQAPDIQEQNSSSPEWYKVLVYGPGNDDNFRHQARQVQRDLQQLPGVANVMNKGLEDAELNIVFHPERLAALGIEPSVLSNTVQAYFKDIPAGKVKVDGREWSVRVTGTEDVLSNLAALPILGEKSAVKLGELADITRSSREALLGARFRGQPAIVLMPFKQPGANALQLIDQINAYIDTRNKLSASTGVSLFLLIDTSDAIREAIHVMEEHAWSGMVLVLAVTWLMLGTRLAFLTTLAVPFSLAGVFIALQLTGQSLNMSVLLGVVLVLGMLVDDAVVVIEAIGQHLRRGLPPLDATVAALREVWLPVATSSFTTMASFLPLMLIQGFLGNLMGIVPQVVCLGLLISLVQALWILPAQAVVAVKPETGTTWRERLRQTLQLRYTSLLIKVLRRPKRSLLIVLSIFALTGIALKLEWVNFGLLPEQPSYDLFISLEMPNGTSTQKTLAKLEEIEARITPLFKPGELRASAIESGEVAINGKFLSGHQYGDIWFSMNSGHSRDSATIVPLARQALDDLSGTVGVWVQGENSFWQGQVGKPIKLTVYGASGLELNKAIAELKAILSGIPGVQNVQLDSTAGLPELKLRLNGDAIERAGLNPSAIANLLQMLSGGEIIGNFIDGDESVGIRVRAYDDVSHDINALLQHTITRSDGSKIPLSQLVFAEQRDTPARIAHLDYKRVLTIQADLDKAKLDTLAVNQLVKARWDEVKDHYPDVKLELGGEMETITQGLSQLWQQFVLGIGLIFIIVGAQFRSYRLPFLVLLKVPMAFMGLILGLLISREPISLYTLYGAVALAGIAVNSAILMFSAAQDRLESGMGVVHATVYAARRRMLPILITSFTTLMGLLPLAMSSDKSSTQWRPVASAIVWGVGFSTILTLFIVPLLYRLAMGFSYRSNKLGL
ncbi:efflux RND transporter permease subunit [Methyloglobulus sp.]|uniref:efflux RND transporter permease subunit n=1 Tax=Methyloglobulus sp. TaxID=2518622 RepID=UPI001830E43A|nr:efflux RND transporter permease subunit [Methyloglobulus sp.]